MVFDTSAESDAYLGARGKIVLNACPGSGKTTCIIRKLPLLESECKAAHGDYAGIICLSFTNVAKNEILQRYRTVYGFGLKYPHDVSTIDSFINHYITLPYYNLLNSRFPRPNIVDQASVIDKLIKRTFLYKGKPVETIASPANKYKTKQDKPMYRSYAPSSICIDVNGRFSFNGKNPGIDKVDPNTFQEYGAAVFGWKLNNGFITSLDSAYLALQILERHTQIGTWLVKRFPYILIDEAQDNSEIQHAIFDKLLSLGLENLELIGDPYQSLYEWRDAKPQLFAAKYNHSDWTGLLLTDNRRSVQRIIDFFSIVRSSNDVKINSLNVEDDNLKIVIYKYSESNMRLIVENFELRCVARGFKDNHIVVRGKTLLHKMIGEGSEVAPWKQAFPYKILEIKHLFELGATKEAVNELRKLFLSILYPDMKYAEMQQMVKEAKSDISVNSRLYQYLFHIPATNQSLVSWSQACNQSLIDHFGMDVSHLFEFKLKISGYRMAVLKTELVDAYFYKPASNNHNIPVSTIHQIKGATLDALLYIVDENGSGESVGMNSFVSSGTFPDEKQRMIYVACSRPKQLLALGVPSKTTDADLHNRFGTEIEIVSL